MALHHDHDPEPPFKLANRVMKLPSDDAAGFAEFEERGAETKAMLPNLLPEGTSLEDKRLLDFGCGAGRTLRHFLGEAERAEIWGGRRRRGEHRVAAREPLPAASGGSMQHGSTASVR